MSPSLPWKMCVVSILLVVALLTMGCSIIALLPYFGGKAAHEKFVEWNSDLDNKATYGPAFNQGIVKVPIYDKDGKVVGSKTFGSRSTKTQIGGKSRPPSGGEAGAPGCGCGGH